MIKILLHTLAIVLILVVFSGCESMTTHSNRPDSSVNCAMLNEYECYEHPEECLWHVPKPDCAEGDEVCYEHVKASVKCIQLPASL